MTEKQQAILMALNSIPPGHVTSYGEVARRAGLPGYARMVCRVLRELPDRSRTPWWRVIRADGRFGMAEDCSAGREQRLRLREEGITIERDRVRGPWW
jgi:methylated-DNA-protein-cysteine methyltransferase-like protein